MENTRVSFNHAVMGVSVRFIEGKSPEIQVVDYINDEGKVEMRFPGGTVQFVDIYESVENYINGRDDIDSRSSLLWLPLTISDFDKKFHSEVNLLESRHEKNMHLESYLTKILEKLQSSVQSGELSEEDLSMICLNSRLATIKREFKEETDASKIGDWICVSQSLAGDHQRGGYLSVNTEAPEEFIGSGDSDIKRSYWISVKLVENLISSKHRNYLYSAVREGIKENVHPRFKELADFCRATNH